MYYGLLCALPALPDEVGPPVPPVADVAEKVMDALDLGGIQIAAALLQMRNLEPEREAWALWFEQLEDLAREHRSAWLAEFADFECSLRRSLAHRRGGPPVPDSGRHRALLQALDSADPLAVERGLDRARLSAMSTSGFGRDAVFAYLAASLVLERWASPDGDPSNLSEVLR